MESDEKKMFLLTVAGCMILASIGSFVAMLHYGFGVEMKNCQLFIAMWLVWRGCAVLGNAAIKEIVKGD